MQIACVVENVFLLKEFLMTSLTLTDTDIFGRRHNLGSTMYLELGTVVRATNLDDLRTLSTDSISQVDYGEFVYLEGLNPWIVRGRSSEARA